MTQSTVNLILSADTETFSAAIRQAEQEFSSRFKQMGTLSKAQSIQIQDNFNGISSAAERLSTAFKQAAQQLTLIVGAATGIALLGKNMLRFADNTVKTADRIGVTTNLLQELRFAASQTGVTTDQLESSLEQFTKRIGEAANGTGKAASTYERLGISVLAADGSIRGSESILADVANAMKGIDSQAERAAVSAALFGKQGIAMSLMLSKGASGIEVFKKQAQTLGIVIDENLLRHSEEAVDKLEMLGAILKSQVASAFVQIAPSIINFSQMIVSALPKIKEMISALYGFKDAFILLAKAIIVGKLVSFSAELISASKSFIVVSVATLKFTDAMVLMGKAVRGIGVGLAILGIVEALSLLKQHLDLNKEIKGYIQSQQTLIDANQQFSLVSRINVDAFKALSQAEQQSYYQRLKAAQQFWQAKLALEARKDFQSDAAMSAAKENLLFLENLRQVETVFTKRAELELTHTTLLNKIRGEETTKLKQSMSEQLKIFDKANNDLQALKEKRKSIAKEFQDLINEINTGPQKAPENLSVLDILSAQQAARDALKAGNNDQALKEINQAKEVIRSLLQSGGATKSYLTEQAKVTGQIGDEVVTSQIQAQEKNIQAVKDKIAEIKAEAQSLQSLTVAFDVNGAMKSADEMRQVLQQQLAGNPLKISAIVIPGDQAIDSRVDDILKPQKKARGGLILGSGTSMSDSILARLSNGEFVIRAAAVKHYGLSLLNQLNQKQLPRFAMGGLVPPNVPAISSPAIPNGHQVASITLNLGNDSFAVRTSDVDVVQALTKAVAREALKSGRRV